MRVADLGTGSGAIGLALANEMPTTGVEVWITDSSDDALDVARANIAGIGRNAANVRVAGGSWCDAFPLELRASFDVIVANPPYIAADDPELDVSVRAYEPHSALFAANDGLADVFMIARQAREWLAPSGWLVIEIGHTQGAVVRDELVRLGYADPEIRRDLAGRDRIVVGRVR